MELSLTIFNNVTSLHYIAQFPYNCLAFLYLIFEYHRKKAGELGRQWELLRLKCPLQFSFSPQSSGPQAKRPVSHVRVAVRGPLLFVTSCPHSPDMLSLTLEVPASGPHVHVHRYESASGGWHTHLHAIDFPRMRPHAHRRVFPGAGAPVNPRCGLRELRLAVKTSLSLFRSSLWDKKKNSHPTSLSWAAL